MLEPIAGWGFCAEDRASINLFRMEVERHKEEIRLAGLGAPRRVRENSPPRFIDYFLAAIGVYTNRVAMYRAAVELEQEKPGVI